jgi:hypothetical protein
VPAKLSDYKKRIFDAISSLTDSFQNPDFLNNYIASMNEPVDMNIINSKAIKEIAELDRKIAEEKTAIDAMLRNGVKIPDMIGWHAEGAKYVSERIKIIEAEKTSPPVPVVTQPVSTPAPAQPLEFYEAYQAARAAQAKRAIEAEQKAAETAPVLSGHAATPTAAPPEPMPPEAAVTQSTPAPVPQPAAAPRKKVFSRPLADVIAKRGVNRRTLTDKERHDLAFPDPPKLDPTTLADLVKASEAAPPQARASPAHAPQPAPLPPPRTEDVQRTPPERSPLPLSQTSISPAAPDRHGGNSAAATQTNLAPQIEPAKKAPAESAAPTATIPAPPTAPGTTVVQQKLSASETTATPQEPSPPTTKAVTAPEPDAQGPIIPITDNPKKKRKKRGEMSIEERRRVLIAQQKARSGPSR